MFTSSLFRFKVLVLFWTCGILIPNSGYGQSNNAEAALYNIGIGSVFSGICALFNKEPEERFGRVLLKGIAQGALGGYIVYESKILVGEIAKQERQEINWAAKLVNSAGISIIENASSNRNFWEQWNLCIGFNRIEFHTNKDFKIKYRIMPTAFLLTAYSAIGNKFEIKKSLQTGEFIFSGYQIPYRNDGFSAGSAVGPAIILNPHSLNDYRLFSHELIHVYQYQDYNFINAYFKKPLNELGKKSAFLNKLNNIFYYDVQAPFGRGLYLLENLSGDNYYDNFIEHEAYYYSN
ncbi:hypothetical protein [Salinimicrobium sp. GXAS 041]|uniref:hypothetical protein n=1 Tax=Salinimicrobium sp. GXAS 041 TaxID=3400806 RepID=UPI003C749946